MKRLYLNKYSIAAVLFLVAAAALIAIALNIYFGEFIIAAFIISAMALAMAGIFVLSFSGGEPVDPRFVGSPSCTGMYKSLQDSVRSGYSWQGLFSSPPRYRRVPGYAVQPGLDSTREVKCLRRPHFPKTGPAGLVTIPSANPLVQELRKRNALVIPENEEHLSQLDP